MKKPIVFVALYFVILGLFAAMTFLLPATTFSPNENRYLTQMPALNGDAVLSGGFQEQLSEFLSDQIPGRDFWIRTNTAIKKLLGKKEVNGVYLGADGYYFQQFTQDSYSAGRAAAIFNLIQEFAQGQTASVAVMMVPTPAAVLKDKLPASAPMYDADGVWKQMQDAILDANFVDLRETFADAAKDTQLYYRTDHHWTTQGAYVAYEAYCAAMGLDAVSREDFALQKVSDDFYGTIYSKTLDAAARPDEIWSATALPQIEITFDETTQGNSVYAESFLSQKDQYAYFFGGNWGKVDIRTQANNGKRLLVIKDSFANSFVPYLLGEYEQIVMLDLRYFGGSVTQEMEANSITDVLFLYEMTNLLTDNGIVRLNN